MLSPDHKAIFEYTRDRVGRPESVFNWLNDDETISVALGRIPDSPEPSLSTYATLNLSDHDIELVTPSADQLRVELLGTTNSPGPVFEGGIASCALNVATGDFQPKPGRIFPNVFISNDDSQTITTPHALLWYPFSWDATFDPLMLGNRQIEWLLALPITDGEYELVRSLGGDTGGAGVERLIDLFEAQRTDVWDLTRGSVA